ncbi:hypothetical protein ID866_7021 [Astraeus odoratus]|nr:hypothetical protein ID866_7021 [Astraeus odoratus]
MPPNRNSMSQQRNSLIFLVTIVLILLALKSTKNDTFTSSAESQLATYEPWLSSSLQHSFPSSFVDGISTNISRLHSGYSIGPHGSPGVTAIILNWSRLSNVVRIASLLCGEFLRDTVAEVLIWNNSPQELTYADDDFLVLPQIIRILRDRIEQSPQTAIHLLPAHQHLSSRLHTLITPSGVHTGFAWLGYGAMLSQKQASDFVALLRHLNMPQENVDMADNYFTILSNQIPEIWFDHGIELAGGQPFTVGLEGHERNKRHIRNACAYLDQLAPVIQDDSYLPTAPEVASFVKATTDTTEWLINRTPCLGSSCFLETNIRLLRDDILTSPAATDLFHLGERRLNLIGRDAISNYTEYPIASAVDGIPMTEFRSPSCKPGEYVMLDMLSIISAQNTVIELVFLIPRHNEQILRNCAFQSSADGDVWVPSSYSLVCRDTPIFDAAVLDSQLLVDVLIECSIQMNEGRFFMALLDRDAPVAWTISEVWLRTGEFAA